MVSSVQKLLIASGSKCKSIDTQENRNTLCPINTAFRKRQPESKKMLLTSIYLALNSVIILLLKERCFITFSTNPGKNFKNRRI